MTHHDNSSASATVWDELVSVTEERAGCRRDGGFAQFRHQEWRQRLQQVLLDLDSTNNNSLAWMQLPLIRGLLSATPERDLNVTIGPPSSSSALFENQIYCQDNIDEEDNDPLSLLDSHPILSTNEEPRPLLLLVWLCQWKYLAQHYHWKGSDDMVLLALRMGATVSTSNVPNEGIIQHNLQNSVLVAAIQYGSVTTLQHLVQAYYAKQQRQQTKSNSPFIPPQQPPPLSVQEWIHQEAVFYNLWKLVLDRACPYILTFMMRYLDAQERVLISRPEWLLGTPATTTTPSGDDDDKEVHVTAVDYLLHKLWQWCREETNTTHTKQTFHRKATNQRPIEMPPVNDFDHCIFILLQQDGPTYTPLTMELLLSQLWQYQESHPTAKTHYAFQIVQLFFGNWIPQQVKRPKQQQAIMQRDHAKDDQLLATNNVCVICLEENHEHRPLHPNNPIARLPIWIRQRLRLYLHRHHRPMITLYCGHAFCVDCILQWGASDPEILPKTRTVELGCPICRQPLSREFLSEPNRVLLARAGHRRRNTLGIVNGQFGPCGPQWLSPNQIQLEWKARGMSMTSYQHDQAKQLLLQQWNQVQHQRRHGPNIMVDLAASYTISPQHVAPKLGLALIPIQVNDISLLAGLSGSSPYTVVSRDAVKQLGLVVTGLASNRFQSWHPVHYHHADNSGSDDEEYSDSCGEEGGSDSPYPNIQKHWQTMAVLNELVILLGEGSSQIEVRLKNAVVSADKDNPSDTPWRPGIVLGLDFLESAAWTQTCVEVDIGKSLLSKDVDDKRNRRFMVLVHGGTQIQRINDPDSASSLQEEFRYYDSSGKIFRCPLFHIQPSRSKCLLSIGHVMEDVPNSNRRRRQQRFRECDWCCRMFPVVGQNIASGLEIWWHRSQRHSFLGMKPCQFCCDTTDSSGLCVFYCDKTCQQKARQVHRLRHEQYRGVWISWIRITMAICVEIIRQQRRSFLFSFFAGVLVSLWYEKVRSKAGMAWDEFENSPWGRVG